MKNFKGFSLWLFFVLLLSALSFQLSTKESCAFFVGFGAAGGAEQVIKQGQEAGIIPKTPGETPPGGPKQLTNAETMWQKRWNNGSNGHGIAVDSSGNAYVTGNFYNGADFDYLTIKYDTNGNTIWQKIYDGGHEDEAYGIAVDSSGNVYVTGYCTGTYSPTHDYLIIKYDTNGNTVWQRTYNGGNVDQANGIAVDSSGNVYVIGYSYNGSSYDCLTVKYDTNGNTIWQKAWDSGSHDWAYGIAVDSSGNIYVTGVSSLDCLTIKYNSSGDVVWQKTWSSGSSDCGYGIAVDSSGNVYVTGWSHNGANDDYRTTKYNSSGETLWQKRWDGGDMDRGYSIAVDSSKNVYVTGQSFNGATDD